MHGYGFEASPRQEPHSLFLAHLAVCVSANVLTLHQLLTPQSLPPQLHSLAFILSPAVLVQAPKVLVVVVAVDSTVSGFGFVLMVIVYWSPYLSILVITVVDVVVVVQRAFSGRPTVNANPALQKLSASHKGPVAPPQWHLAALPKTPSSLAHAP
jgi:hypothetical protein